MIFQARGYARRYLKIFVGFVFKSLNLKIHLSPTGAVIVSKKEDDVLDLIKVGMRYFQVRPLEDAHLREFLLNNLMNSYSLNLEDLIALYFHNSKEEGFFVEFGACDGVELSNTFLLEKRFNWQGILAEPARGWHDALLRNRTARIDNRAVWIESGEFLPFQEVGVKALSGILSTFRPFAYRKRLRIGGRSYKVETVSLNDLLSQLQAPSEIDFMSIDTEGSEFEIIKGLDFERWKPQLICIEHGFDFDAREQIRTLLLEKGYEVVFEPLSYVNDWYALART